MKHIINIKMFGLILMFITSCGLKGQPIKINNENHLIYQENIENEITEREYSFNNIYDLINKIILINDNWAGQSFTFVIENGDYYIYRKINGSGVPYIGTIVYNAIIESDYKIKFYEIVDTSENIKNEYNNEIFELYINKEIRFYINGLQLKINYID
ncbi:MAG: hypothetical protein FWC12_12165 [Treponema sp.]|nr:hypothetical protein [Treponema sp.]